MSESTAESTAVHWGTFSRRAQDLLLHHVSSDALLFLFTPTSLGQATYDPFEVLGRALSDHFPRLRHVPYSIYGGMTEAHSNLILCKSTINIVVVAEVPHSCSAVNGEVHGTADELRSISSQMQFANLVRSIAPRFVSEPPRPAPPAILITIGRSLMTTWRARVGALQDWQLVLNIASNDPTAVHKAVDVLVGEASADRANGETQEGHAMVVKSMNSLSVQDGTSDP